MRSSTLAKAGEQPEDPNIPKISVIIVNYNGGQWLARCVDSIALQSFTDFECILVDNGSTDGSLGTLPDLDDRFQIIEAGENLGFAAGNNLGARKASGEWLALLNPDAFAHVDWLEKLLYATTLAPNVTMVGSTQYMALEPGIYDGVGDFYHVSGIAWRGKHGHPVGQHGDIEHVLETAEVFAPCGAGAFYHRDTYIRLGGFDERFFCYHEDVDLGFRLRLDGGICIQSAEAKIDHVSSGISGRASEFAVYHGTRNRIWTFVKNMPGGLLALFAPTHILLNIAFLIWSLFRKGRARPTWRGVRDGITGLPDIWRSREASHNIKPGQLLRIMTLNPLKFLMRDDASVPIKNRRTQI